MRKKIISILLIASLLLSSMALAACKKSAEEDAEEVETTDIDELIEEAEGDEEEFDGPSDSEDPAYDNEADGAEIVQVSHEEADFYGDWSAKSQTAHHLFGNADFSIKKDGTWTGNIVDEDFQGKWTYADGEITIKSDDDLINYKLFFVEDGNLMFQDQDNPDMIALVLKKQ